MTALGSRDSRWRFCRGPWADHRRLWGWVAEGWGSPCPAPARPGLRLRMRPPGGAGRDRPRFLAAVVPPGPGRLLPVTPSARHRSRPWCCARGRPSSEGRRTGTAKPELKDGAGDRRCDVRELLGVASETAFRRDPPLRTSSLGCSRAGPGSAGVRGGGVPPGSGARLGRGPGSGEHL